MQLAIQSQNDNKKLQKAKMRIRELEELVVDLKLKVQYLQKQTRPATNIHENKAISIVNVADIKSKISDQEIPMQIPRSTASVHKNVNSSTVVQPTTTAINHNENVDLNEKCK